MWSGAGDMKRVIEGLKKGVVWTEGLLRMGAGLGWGWARMGPGLD